MHRLSWGFATVLSLLAGCTSADPPDVDGGAECGSERPCAEGWTCIDGRCRENAARDAGMDAAWADSGTADAGTADASADADVADADADITADGGGDGGPEDAGLSDAGPPPCRSAASCPPLTACVGGFCVPSRLVFVTSRTYGADFGSLAAADAACQELGDAALPGRRWMAWLSDHSTPVRDRLTHSSIPYRRVDGALVAMDWSDLVDRSLANPIDHDENNLIPLVVERDSPEVWTGSYHNGAEGRHCASWSTSTAWATATVGWFGATDEFWSFRYEQFCDRTNVRLYCFEE